MIRVLDTYDLATNNFLCFLCMHYFFLQNREDTFVLFRRALFSFLVDYLKETRFIVRINYEFTKSVNLLLNEIMLS